MTQTSTRPLNDQPTTHRLLTTDEGKMYNLYILEPDGTTITLDDDTIFFDWKDHCINPSAFKYLADKHNCQYTEHTLKHIHEQFLQNYLGSDSPLDVCIDDQLVRVNITSRGIELYAYRLGLDRTFSSIDSLNDFLIERGSPTYYNLKQDVTETWRQVLLPTKPEEKSPSYYVRQAEDPKAIQVVMIKQLDTGDYTVTPITLTLTELDYLRTLKAYYYDYFEIKESIAQLTVFYLSQCSRAELEPLKYKITSTELVQHLESEYKLDLSL